MRQRKLKNTLLSLSTAIVLGFFLIAQTAECRVGGGRSFGSRGSRGFSTPGSYGNRSFGGNSYSVPSRPQAPPASTNPGYSNPWNQRPYQAPSPGSSFLRSMGAGIAGGFIGNMLFRSMGWGGGYGMGGMGGGGGGGFGIFEFLILLGVIFFLFKFLARKNLPESGYGNDSPNQPPRDYSGYSMSNNGTDREAANLMREARPNGWSGGNSSSPEVNRNEFQNTEDAGGTPIDRDQAMDLFFQVQGAWANRDLASASSILDTEAKTYLEEELFRLRALKQINRLENIAVRDVQTIESWREMGKEYSTVRITANLLDFTVDENSGQVVSGSKTTPVKFEEYWTFVREQSSPWKLSAIQQN